VPAASNGRSRFDKLYTVRQRDRCLNERVSHEGHRPGIAEAGRPAGRQTVAPPPACGQRRGAKATYTSWCSRSLRLSFCTSSSWVNCGEPSTCTRP